MAESIIDYNLKGKKKQGGKKHRKYGRNIKKCAAYRSSVGKPRGRGVPGNKRGKKGTRNVVPLASLVYRHYTRFVHEEGQFNSDGWLYDSG